MNGEMIHRDIGKIYCSKSFITEILDAQFIIFM